MQPFQPFKSPKIPGIDVREDPMTPSTARQFARDPGPGNPNVGPTGSPEARAFRQQGLGSVPAKPIASPASSTLASMPGTSATPPLAKPPVIPGTQSLAYRAGNAVGNMASTTRNFVTSPGFTKQPLSQVGRGALQSTTGALGKASRVLSSPVAVGLAGGFGAMKGLETDTEQYAKRFGLENTEPGLLRDTGIRALGVASDIGDALTLGQASRLYRDTDQEGGNVFNPVRPALTPNPSLPPVQQMDPTSPIFRDPANPMNPKNGAAAALATPPQSSSQIAPGVFRQGNSYGDSPESAAAFANNKPVSAQNMAAADRLAQRYTNPLVEAAQGSQNLTPRTSGSGFGLLDQAARDRRSAMMDTQAGKPGARIALASLLKQQADEPNQQIERDRLDLSERQGDADRDIKRWTFAQHIRDADENRRLKTAELSENSLVNLSKRRALDVETNAATQLAQLRGDYLNADNDQDRRTAAEKLATLSGRPAGDDYITVRGGSRYDPNSMAVVNEPDILVSRTTGKAINFDGSPNEAAQLVPGKLYQHTDDNGKTRSARYLGNGKWQPVE